MPGGEGRLILLVEDQVVSGLAERAELVECGYRVLMARNGREAVEKALSDPSIDLVLMDVDLGEGMDGPEAAARILELRDLPIVFLSGHAERQAVERTEAITNYGYVLKDSGLAVLDASIRMAFRLHEARREARESEASLEAVLASALEGVLAVDGEGRVVHSNARYREMWGLPSELVEKGEDRDLIAHVRSKVLDPEGFVARIEELYVSGREGQDLILFRDGRAIERISTPLVLDGKLSGRVWSFRDITERRRSEESIRRLLEEKDLILKEVHHRIKNNMNMVNGFLVLQADKSKEPAAAVALLDAATRVRGMMLLYDKLFRSRSFVTLSVREYLASLVDDVVSAFPVAGKIAVRKDIEDFPLDVKRLQSVGIVLNELLTNSMKHAFDGREKGHIGVSFREEEGMARLAVEDDGVGMPGSIEAGSSPGFGLSLVAGMAEQLEGGLEVRRQSGTRVELSFPLRSGTASSRVD